MRHLKRYTLGTSYPSIVADVRQLCLRSPFDHQPLQLALDSTGDGVAVTEMFTLARPAINATITPITIHGGAEVTSANGGCRVPKRELVSTVQAVLQSDRLRIAASLPEVPILTSELQNFQVSISESRMDTYYARTGAHDDLVLALAMGVWLAGRAQSWDV